MDFKDEFIPRFRKWLVVLWLALLPLSKVGSMDEWISPTRNPWPPQRWHDRLAPPHDQMRHHPPQQPFDDPLLGAGRDRFHDPSLRDRDRFLVDGGGGINNRPLAYAGVGVGVGDDFVRSTFVGIHERLQCWICSDYSSDAVDLLTANYNRRNVPRCPDYSWRDPNGTLRAYGNLIEAHSSGLYRCVVFQEGNARGKVVIRGMALDSTLDSEFGLRSEGCQANVIFPRIDPSRDFYVCTCRGSRCNSNSANGLAAGSALSLITFSSVMAAVAVAATTRQHWGVSK